MVSPSKIFKTSNAGYKVGIVSSKTYLKTQGGSKQRTPSSQVKNSHPLANTKFYLDIRNRAQLAEVESTLKSYGAKVELFFGKDIKVVVTDKTEWIGNGQSPSASISPLTTPSPSSNQDQRFALPKTRSSAMLEKVSRQPISPYSSPLELAQKWRIPVLPVPSLWQWIAKIEEAFLAKLEKKKESKIVAYASNSPFIKIESSVSPNVPEFLVLGSWPRLNLDGHLGRCPFRSPSPPSPSVSDEEPKEVENHFFDAKDKVAVELIKYDTDFRIKDNIKIGECEEEAEGTDVSGKQDIDFEGLNRALRECRDGIQAFASTAVHKSHAQTFFYTHCIVKPRNSRKMTRRPAKGNSVNSEDESINNADARQNLLPLCNGYGGRSITRQSSHELLKVQCNGLTTSHRNSKLLSPSGSDVLPLPTSRRTTRRASASWCGSTRELSQLSPTDSEIENIRRSESSFEANDTSLDSPGITLRPKGQLWLPIALIGTTAEENGNCIRKRYEYSLRQSDNSKLTGDLLEPVNDKIKEDFDEQSAVPRAGKDSDSSLNSNSSPNDYQIKRNCDKKDAYCIITRNTKIKNHEVNGKSRESSVESHKSEQGQPKSRTEGKKRSFSVSGRISPSVKRARTMSTNSINSVARKKKLSPEEKLLQDNKEYFKMEVLNTKLRSSGSLLNVSQNKDPEASSENCKPQEKIDKIIIKKIKIRGKRKRSKWTKTNAKKVSENYATIIVENKKNNVKINGIIKRKRQSELMKLCNEAETFMFGESSRQGNTGSNTTESGDIEDSPRKKNSGNLTTKLNSHENSFTRAKPIKTRRKRRSHAEAFIHDNLDYYKFETPGSRLRYQGSFLDVKSEDKDFIYTLRQKRKERFSTEQNKKNELLERLQLCVDIKEERLESQEKRRNVFKPSEEIQKILFSFESIPETEPWYAVYKRQDEGMENYYPLLSDPNDQPFLLPYELPKPVYPKVPTVSEYYKRRRKKLMHLFNHPRKSPRCHASTLAILSSLKRRKKRSGTNISMSAMLSESPPSSSVPANAEKPEEKSGECDRNEAESEEMLDLFFKSESDEESEEILLEPLSDSEGKPKRKNSDSGKSGKSDDEDIKPLKTGSRSKKLTRFESQSECDSGGHEEKQFSLQTIQPDSFIKDMVIEIKKNSGLTENIMSVLENFRNCRSMEETDADLISNPNGNSKGDLPDSRRRRRKKARKINKTGWDNRKSRRRTGIKVTELKELESDAQTLKPNSIKTKVRNRDNCISAENIISGSKRRLRRGENDEKKSFEPEDRPVLRSHIDAGERLALIRRVSQDSESQTESVDSSGAAEYPPCVVRMKKIPNSSLGPSVRLKCSKGKYSIQKRRLVLTRKKKRVIDYAWTTKRRR